MDYLSVKTNNLVSQSVLDVSWAWRVGGQCCRGMCRVFVVCFGYAGKLGRQRGRRRKVYAKSRFRCG